MDLWSSLKSVGFVGSEIWGALRLSGRGHIQDHPGAWAGAPALRTGPQGSPCSSSEPTLSTRQTHQAKAMPTHWLCGALLSPQGLDIRVWSSHSQLLEPPRASARPPLPGGSGDYLLFFMWQVQRQGLPLCKSSRANDTCYLCLFRSPNDLWYFLLFGIALKLPKS